MMNKLIRVGNVEINVRESKGKSMIVIGGEEKVIWLLVLIDDGV